MELNKDCVRDILLYVKKYCGDPNSHIGKTTLDVSLDELCKSEQCSKYEIRIWLLSIKSFPITNIKLLYSSKVTGKW